MTDERRAPLEGIVGRQGEAYNELIHVLRDLRRVVWQEPFKPPRFTGNGDVELFISQFTEVATANQWNNMAALLHLREALQGDAKEYGRPCSTEEIFAALRSRYGLTTREARSRLNNLKRDSRKSLHDHANQVEGLSQIAFRELPEEVRTNMKLDAFCSSLGNSALQRHLLATQPETMAEAVQRGNEYLQVSAERPAAGSAKIRTMEGAKATTAPEQDPMEKLIRDVQTLALKLEQLEQRTAQPS